MTEKPSFFPKNVFGAFGILFFISGAIIPLQNLIIWGPEFVEDFLLNGEVTNEKVSMGMLAFGIFMVALGFRKHEQKR